MAVNKLDITMMEDVGTSANQLLQRDGSGNMPAVNASQVSGLSEFTTSTSDPAIDTNPSGGVGSLWYNKTGGEMYICTDATAGENVWTNVGEGTGDIQFFQGGGSNFGYVVGGYPAQPLGANLIQKYSYASDGNAVDAGQDMNYTGGEAGYCSSTTYGYVMIRHSSAFSSVGTITKYQFNTSNDMTTVGSLSTGSTQRNQCVGTMSSTYGYCMGGGEPTEIDVVDKWIFSSDGNASDVGNLTQSRRYGAGTCSTTHGYYAGGHSAPPYWDIIDKFPFASDTNSTDVGNLLVAHGYMNTGAQSITYGYCCGGNPGGNVIEKWSYASDGNSTDVGDLLDSVNSTSCTSSTNYGYRNGGSPPPYSDRIDKWSFTTDGNATDVGNMNGACGSTLGGQY